MKQILIPVDFSINAEKAAVYGCMLAQKTGASVTLFHAIEPVADNLRQPFSLHEKYMAQVMDDRLNELAILKYELEKTYPGISINYIALHGVAVPTIINFIKSINPKLVVMGTKGRTALEKIFMGNVAKGVVARSTMPVIVVPDKYVQSKVDAIVIATNHFEKDVEHLEIIIELASIFKAAVHVVVFIDTDTAAGYDYSEISFQLNSYSEFLNRYFPQVSFKTELLEGPDFDNALEKYDKSVGADILILFTYPKSIWERIINKSIAKKMVSKSRIPMLVVPVKENED